MKGLKMVCLFVTLQFGAVTAFSQENEFGCWGGASVYVGDLNPTFSFKNARWATGIFYRHNLNDRMAVRAAMNYGFIEGNDRRIKRLPYLQARNLNFKSHIAEFATTFEVNFFRYSLVESKDTKRWTPYLFMGASIFYYNPYTYLGSDKYRLEPIGTEGQKTANRPTKNKGYDNYAISIPYGVGIKVGLTNNWAIGIEASSRISFSDYLDDVSGVYAEPDDINFFVDGQNIALDLHDRSATGIGIPGKQRGTSKDKDRFIFVGLTLSYTINQLSKCPKVF